MQIESSRLRLGSCFQHATAKEVRSELSLPRFINSSGFITDWAERIILPPLDNSGGIIDEPFGDGDGDGGIDIVVEPKYETT